MLRLLAIWSIIFLCASALLWASNKQADTQLETARQSYIATAKASARSELQKLDRAFKSIYENVRTIASLPSVRTIDRYGRNLSGEARVTLQQIYNNLASGVAVSEVYIVPIDFDPEKIDPVTTQPQAPILMFDQLILNAGARLSVTERLEAPLGASQYPLVGPPEVEIHEYRQLKVDAAWLRQHYPTSAQISGLDVPFLSGPELITCDNTDYITTGDDADRSGILFSVPFYSVDGHIKGLISATILTSALRKLLPAPHFALVNPGNQYANLATGTQEMTSSLFSIRNAEPDPSLDYSEVIPLSVSDSRSPWYVWTGLSNDTFQSSPAAISVSKIRRANFNTIIVIALAAAICAFFVLKTFDQGRKLNASLVAARDLAISSEVEAKKAALELKGLNEGISNLNLQLIQKAEELRAAQEDIVRKAKMAQLGTLIATVAHELRNPLSVVRTTSFALQRRLRASGIDAGVQLARIESGVKRCDGIISQLLDFSRSKAADTTATDVDAWLEATLNEEVAKLPDYITITCRLNLQNLKANIDPDLMVRVIINLLSNAAEAMDPKGRQAASMKSRTPHIDVSTGQTARGIEIVFADNGPGIPGELLDKIREPLFTTKGFGTGLGIPAIEKILDQHDGGLEVDSILGEGARFTVWFPINGAEQRAA